MTPLQASTMLEQWLAVQVWAGREQLCSRSLRLRGYDVFLPTYHVNRRWSDRMKRVECALFEGYTFCRARGPVSAAIVTTPGVIGIVNDGVNPLPVPDEEVESIRRIVDSALEIEPCPMARVGQRVRVEVGPLEGVEGIVERVKNKHRLVVSVQLLRRAVAVDIDAGWVRLSNDELFDAIRQRRSTGG